MIRKVENLALLKQVFAEFRIVEFLNRHILISGECRGDWTRDQDFGGGGTNHGKPFGARDADCGRRCGCGGGGGSRNSDAKCRRS